MSAWTKTVAPRLGAKFKALLNSHGLQCSASDPCLFYNTAAGHKLIIVLCVDAEHVTSQNESDMLHFLSELKREFIVTILPVKPVSKQRTLFG